MPPLIFTTIASGSNISPNIDLRQQSLISIRVPGITSGDLTVQGNVDQTSAGFYRLLETRTPGSGDLRFATGVGSRMIPWPPSIPTPAWARLEIVTAPGSFQASTRSLEVLTQPRHLT